MFFLFFLLLAQKKETNKKAGKSNRSAGFAGLAHKHQNYWLKSRRDLVTFFPPVASLRDRNSFYMMQPRVAHTAGAEFFACSPHDDINLEAAKNKALENSDF